MTLLFKRRLNNNIDTFQIEIINFKEIKLSRELLLNIIIILSKRKNQFKLSFNKNKQHFDDLVKEQIELISSLLLEIDKFTNDLIRISNSINRYYLIDLYKMDIYYLKYYLSEKIVKISEILQGQFNINLLNELCDESLQICFKIEKIINLNIPLIQKFQYNQISLIESIIIRNSLSIEYLKIDSKVEILSYNKGDNLIDLDQYINLFNQELIKISSYFNQIILKLLNRVENSIDLFFKLSNFYEIDLQQLIQNKSNLYFFLIDFNQIIKFIYSIIKTKLLKLKEFKSIDMILNDILSNLKNLNISINHSRNLLNEIDKIGYKEINYLVRFSNSIDCISIVSLKFNELSQSQF
ncbi:hypothetical protein WICMUC_001508 [Wickerhamomyces mucosus]|uniref:Uncharacterized protein n=1 Tax=Wickerhamomyces mucosus TaxID=1378264 RepID=A0A9P8PUD5_9ASCO|nr:hypothetical protein WICMUC_001508 [Wickerhamomyces mucosus]